MVLKIYWLLQDHRLVKLVQWLKLFAILEKWKCISYISNINDKEWDDIMMNRFL